MAKFSAQDNIRNGYIEDDPAVGNTTARVSDANAHTKLDAIIAALGGSVDTTPKNYQVTIALANTEQSFALPANTKKFIIRNIDNSQILFSYESSGTTSAKFFTIKKNNVFTDNNLYASQSLYFQTPNAGDTIQIITYV